MSSPPHAFRREGDTMIAPAVPTVPGAGMAVDEQAGFCTPSLSPDGSHVVALASAGDEAAMGVGVPSSEHGASERMIDGSASEHGTTIHPPTLVVADSDTLVSEVEV